MTNSGSFAVSKLDRVCVSLKSANSSVIIQKIEFYVQDARIINAYIKRDGQKCTGENQRELCRTTEQVVQYLFVSLFYCIFFHLHCRTIDIYIIISKNFTIFSPPLWRFVCWHQWLCCCYVHVSIYLFYIKFIDWIWLNIIILNTVIIKLTSLYWHICNFAKK